MGGTGHEGGVGTSWAHRPRSARNIFLWAMTLFGVLATAGTLTLATFNLRLDALSEVAGQEAAQARAIEDIRLNLLLLNRAFILLGWTGDAAYRVEGRQALKEAWGALRATKKRARDERELAWLDELERRIDAFVQEIVALQQPGAPVEQQRQRVSEEMSRILTFTEAYLQKVERDQIALQEELNRLNAILTRLSVVASFVLPLSFLLVILLVHRRVFLPFTSLGDSMRSYAAGEKETRAPPSGPTELQDMAVTFNALADQLEREKQSRFEFLLGVAHDLRNPITALKGNLALAEREVEKGRPDAEELAGRFAKVSLLVKRLDRLIADLVDMARLDEGHFDLQVGPCDLGELAREVSSIYENASPLHPIHLELPEEPVFISCDEGRMSQVLGNLLSNAVKYSPAGGEITVRVRTNEKEGIIEVQDKGVGIAPDDLPLIFRSFHRLEPRRATGIGLGLSLAKGLVEAHQGRIEVESQPGKGSTFRVILPLAP